MGCGGRDAAGTGDGMTAKLLIVNNGLKDLTGHYFETSVSIADAARKLGLKPILAAHVTCPRDIIPEWLDFYPLCCTDHWMVAPAPPPPDLRGIRGDSAALARVPVEAVAGGQATVGEYLRARLEPVAFAEEPPPAPPPPLPPPPIHAPLPWKARLKEFGHAVVPPVLVPAARWGLNRGRRTQALVHSVYEQRWRPYEVAKAGIRALLPPFLWTSLSRFKRRPPAAAVAPPLAPPVPSAPPAVAEPEADPLARGLEQLGAGAEYTHALLYQRDLDRILCLTGVGRDDHVFMPTAHGRELLAVQSLVNAHDDGLPMFHLEFRHAMDMGDGFDDPDRVPLYTRFHRVYFDHFRRQPHHPKIKLYTDTEELTEEYCLFSGLCFDTVPIPFRTHFLTAHVRRPADPLCLTYLGDVRDEKGFHWLLDLVEAMQEDYVEAGKVRFVFQASLGSPQYNPKSTAALEQLQALPPEDVTLVGLDGPLTVDEYFQLVSAADVLLCPYCPLTYKRRSSGTLTEAIAAGIPTIVPRDSWLARQQPAGTGETFLDLDGFIDGVRQVCDRYARYHQCARSHKDSWLSVHTPENLVRMLVQGPAEPACSRPCKAA